MVVVVAAGRPCRVARQTNQPNQIVYLPRALLPQQQSQHISIVCRRTLSCHALLFATASTDCFLEVAPIRPIVDRQQRRGTVICNIKIIVCTFLCNFCLLCCLLVLVQCCCYCCCSLLPLLYGFWLLAILVTAAASLPDFFLL